LSYGDGSSALNPWLRLSGGGTGEKKALCDEEWSSFFYRTSEDISLGMRLHSIAKHSKGRLRGRGARREKGETVTAHEKCSFTVGVEQRKKEIEEVVKCGCREGGGSSTGQYKKGKRDKDDGRSLTEA